ncbi:hypothetical protein POSPLADRAFT_1146365 [Postia placenta MAD-698-R-SB12]|uniref:Uncharacterized protein n=1 Tax=Postia placenta MAD-698-R-SB12 TaxID=670580 RepID=A0A1X6MWR4_9APHY|nr:hypothetical protein POSPLADRAFT_1146365 [Postia placenta MAD-698-R-SB12]OSX60815.1 hypothetical protein POSPLADRAFT_1146365 [Postia placenta MAD-698-R-SB12]
MPRDQPEEFKTSNPPPVEMEKTTTFSEIVANFDSAVLSNDAVNVQGWLQAVDCSEDQDGAPCTHEDAVSEHFDVAITTEDDRTPTLNSDTDTEYSDSVDSTDTDALVNAAFEFFAPFCVNLDGIDVDIIPLVKYSFDLTEGGECADPRGFIEEADAMADLIRKARDGTLADHRSETPNAVMPLVEDLVEGLTTEPTLVHSEATTDPNCGKATSSHPSDFQETAVERSADTPLKPSSEVKDETALPEARSFWRLARMKKGDKRPSFSSSKNALSHMSPCTLPGAPSSSARASHRAFLCPFSMSLDLSTKEFVPAYGTYLALWLDPVKMAECVDDPRVRAAARKLSPRKYIGYVDRISRCLIVHGIVASYDLSGSDVNRSILRDRSRSRTAISIAMSTLLKGVSPIRPLPMQPDTQLDGSEAVAEDVLAVDLKNADRVVGWSKTADGSEKPLDPDDADPDVASADMDMAASGNNVDSTPAANDGDESESCTVADDMEDLYVMFDAFLFSKLSDPAFDLIPLVKVSYDLTARGEPADPRGFLEEAKSMAELIRKARDGTLEDVSDSGAVVSVISFDDVQKEECLALVPAAENASAQDSPASDSNTGTSIVEDIPECAGPATTVTEHLADTPPEAQPETEDRPLFPEADPSPHTAEKDVVNTSSRSLKGS